METKPEIITGRRINIIAEGNSGISPEKCFVEMYNEPFSTFQYSGSSPGNDNIYIPSVIKLLFKEYHTDESSYIYRNVYSETNSYDNIDYRNAQFLIRLKDRLLFHYWCYRFSIFYGKRIETSEVENICMLIKKHDESETLVKGRFYMTSMCGDDFNLEQFQIKPSAIDLESNYNNDFINIHKTISDFLKSNGRHGLVLLHGKYGTGKTSYIRHLIRSVNKKIIYFPIDLIRSISSPSFLPFLTQNCKDSILVIEDCEELLRSRETNNITNNGLINLLNLGDGLLADALSLKVICTFNADLKHIDKAILRKGRLVARYDFKELEHLKAQNLSDKLGYSSKINDPMTLADIYNQDLSDFQLNNSRKKVGFERLQLNNV